METMRLTDMLAMRGDGITMIVIGEKYGITKQRVSQLIKDISIEKECYFCGKSFVYKSRTHVNCCTLKCENAWNRNIRCMQYIFTSIDFSRDLSECWNWVGCRDHNGYGRVGGRGGRYAHRYAWTIFNGVIPDRLQVLHHCDNPPCCNPEHLWLGTHRDNMRDRDEKGRGYFGSPRHIRDMKDSPRLPMSAETRKKISLSMKGRHHNAKISEDEVRQIREMRAHKEYSYKELASMYGVNYNTVRKIINYKSWVDI